MFKYKPENVLAGGSPVAVIGAVASEELKKLTPVVKINGKIAAVTKENKDNIVGLCCEDCEANAATCYYATGDFQADSINLPSEVKLADIIDKLEARNIYVKNAEIALKEEQEGLDAERNQYL